jgi:hypothetical protein
MSLYYSETITGAANTTRYGSGITSTEAEPKILKNLWVVVSARQSNRVLGYIEREKRIDVIDHILPLATEATRFRIEINEDIPAGRTWQAALQCGGTATNVYVIYEYDIKG